MSLLIDAGADVNAASHFSAAMAWATMALAPQVDQEGCVANAA
jgi:hypothetical protein